MGRFSARIRALAARLRGRPVVPPGATIGARVHLGHGVALDWSHAHHIVIDDDCTLSPGVRVLAHDSSTRRPDGVTWVAPVRVCRGAFIGADSILLPGVTVGEGAVVGAGSVVTRDVAPGAVVAGNPATVIGDVAGLRERRRALAETGVPVFDEARYHRHPLPDDALETLRAAAERHGGYFLGAPSSESVE